MTTLETINGVLVLRCPAEGEPISGVADALDLIGDTAYQGARWTVVPACRLDDAFFQLRSGVAGEVVQKFAQYGVGLVVLGDISRHTRGSSALRDFVVECDRGRQTWFVADDAELADRLRTA